MIDPIFFDTDCISAFLWVDEQSLLEKIYPGRIVIPQEVYDELDKPNIQHLKARVDKLISAGSAKIMSMDITSTEFALYRQLTTRSNKYEKIIGSGEAASISLVKEYNGILGSNNLRDILFYVEKFSLRHITTGDILIEALDLNLITEKQGNLIWADMLKRKRKLGAPSFTEYMKKKG